MVTLGSERVNTYRIPEANEQRKLRIFQWLIATSYGRGRVTGMARLLTKISKIPRTIFGRTAQGNLVYKALFFFSENLGHGQAEG